MAADSVLAWGVVPDWVTAIATVGALIAAIVAGIWVARQTRATQGQLHLMAQAEADRQELARRDQASRVSAWLTQDEFGRFVALVFNASQQPLYQAAVRFISPNNDNRMDVGTLAPDTVPREVVAVSAFINQARIETRSIDLSWNMPGMNGPVKRLEPQVDGTKKWVRGEWQAGPLGLGIIFTDSHGVRWERSLNGHLEARKVDYEVGGGFVMPLGAMLGDEPDYFGKGHSASTGTEEGEGSAAPGSG